MRHLPLPSLLLPFLFALLLTGPGCVYKLGSGLLEGILDQAAGDERGEGDGDVDGVLQSIIEEELISELGHQLGSGLVSGATELTPEQQARLELAIDGALTVAFKRSAAGLRDEVSPQLREMVRQDIVHALASGIRGELGASVKDTVRELVDQVEVSLRLKMTDERTKDAIAELLRDSIYRAMQEGRPGSPGVGETIETTLTDNVLMPVEHSVGGLTEVVADRVDKSAQRTEHTLQAVISALVIILGVFVLMYMLTRRQLNRARQTSVVHEQELRSTRAALDLLDDTTRSKILGKMDEYSHVSGVAATVPAASPAPPRPAARSDEYFRGEDE